MEWLIYLLVLLCPILMIICMKGHNYHEDKDSPEELEKKLKFLQEENNMLRDELIFF